MLDTIACLLYLLNFPRQVLTPLFIALVFCAASKQQCVATTNRILQWFVAIVV